MKQFILSEMRVSAVIVTHNRLNLLQKTIAAVRQQTLPPEAVFVVDNGSTDGSAKWLDEQPDLAVQHQDNRGSAGGQLAGIKAAFERGFDWIWCMDDDVTPKPTALAEAISFVAASSESIAAVGCGRIDSNTGTFVTGEPIACHFDRFRLRERNVYADRQLYESGSPIRVRMLTFEGMLLNRSAVAAVGFPNPAFFLQLDDFEYSLRLNTFGALYVLPRSQLVRMSSSNLGAFDTQASFRSYLYFCRNSTYYALRSPFLSLRERILSLMNPIKSIYYFFRDVLWHRRGYLRKLPDQIEGLTELCKALANGVIGRMGQIDF